MKDEGKPTAAADKAIDPSSGREKSIPGKQTGIADIGQEIDLPYEDLPNRNIGKREWDEHAGKKPGNTGGDQY